MYVKIVRMIKSLLRIIGTILLFLICALFFYGYKSNQGIAVNADPIEVLPNWYLDAQKAWNDWNIQPLTTKIRWDRLNAIFDRVPEWEITDGSEALDCNVVFEDLKNINRDAIQILEPDIRPLSYVHPKITELRSLCPYLCIGEYRRGHQRGPIPSQQALSCNEKWEGSKSLGNIELYDLSQYGLSDETFALYSQLYAAESKKYERSFVFEEGAEWFSGNFKKCEEYQALQTGGLSLNKTSLRYETLSTSALIKHKKYPKKIFTLKASTNQPIKEAMQSKALIWSSITVKDIERRIPYGQKQGCLFNYSKFNYKYETKGKSE